MYNICVSVTGDVDVLNDYLDDLFTVVWSSFYFILHQNMYKIPKSRHICISELPV
jgi:hypothetical protein